MKQVVFAIALLAMASLTGCLDTDDTSVDENTDTTSDSTGNTNDNTDSGDGGMIDPVGTDGGITIPEDSTIFIDSMGEPGEWNCIGSGADRVCNYEYYVNDYFENLYDDDGDFSGLSYRDSDGVENSIGFNGWVNKTGSTVTIEGLKFPDRGPTVREYSEYDYDDDIYYTVTEYSHYNSNRYVTNTCNSQSTCQIIFYGHSGLSYNGWFTLSDNEQRWYIYEDTDDDGNNDIRYQMSEYAHHTVTFELPFEPYAFSILSGYDLEQQYRSVDRIF